MLGFSAMFNRVSFFMPASPRAGLAEKYLADDLPGAALVGTRLNGILQKIEAGETLTSLAQAYLTSSDQVGGRKGPKTEAMDAAVKARFAAMENDPVLRRKREARESRDRFDIGFIETDCYLRATRVMKQVMSGHRLTPKDVA